MKKLIIILAAAFIFTGCTPTYELEIGNIIKEEINIPVPQSEEKKAEFYEKVKNLSPIIDDFNNEYSYELEESNSNVKLNFSYPVGRYKDNIISNQCFEKFNLTETDDYTHIKASGEFGCLFDADQIDIKIKTYMYVTKSNADILNENTYSWTIDDNNRDNVDLEIMINKKITTPESNNFIKKIFRTVMIIALILGGIYLYINLSKQEKTL